MSQRPVIKVLSPKNGSRIYGDTQIFFNACGFEEVEVWTWKQGPYGGTDAKVASVKLDAAGYGLVVFHAREYPRGPICVRLKGGTGPHRDQYNLQLYNTVGVSWNEGAPDPPPMAADMRLVFLDDFMQMPRITRTGEGARYASSKPGGGDSSQIPFTDAASSGNPFAQMDTYLRLRASTEQHSTGLLSSLRFDGSGIVARAPAYFECRFLAPNAPGTWPAFWVMTKGVHRGLDHPADELDTIEAYGVEDLDHRNQRGYEICAHAWNQGKKHRGIPIVPGNYVDMTRLGAGSTWYEAFHVYGQLITATDTVYYLDNIEVGRHPTQPLSKGEPLFFFVNLAVGGNGWNVDLSRYDGVVDMYVDYVRVFEG